MIKFPIALASGGDIFAGLTALFLYIAIVIGLFLLLRKLVLWYYKVNVVVKEMEKQTELLKIIAGHLDPEKTKTLDPVNKTPEKSDLLKQFEAEKDKISKG